MTYTIVHNESYAYFDGKELSPNDFHIFNKVEALNIMGEDDNEDHFAMVNIQGGLFSIIQTEEIGTAVVYYKIEYDDGAEPDIFGKYKPNEAFSIILDVRDRYDNPVSIQAWNEAEKIFNR